MARRNDGAGEGGLGRDPGARAPLNGEGSDRPACVRLFRAAWIVPVARPPIRDGAIAVRDGRIVAIGIEGDVRAALGSAGLLAAATSTDLGDVVVMPAVVNAHCHLELSWMRGRVPPGTSMPRWALRLMSDRRAAGGDDPAAMREAVEALRASGTGAVADISNTLASVGALAASPLQALVFHEVIGFAKPDPAAEVRAARERADVAATASNVRIMLAAHAPYSVSPAMFQALGEDLAAHPDARLSVHLAESSEEVEFLATGGGTWRHVLETVGAWNRDWTPPGTDPVTYLDGLGLVGPRLLAVHGVHCTPQGLDRLARSGATLVTCPRSNLWTGAGVPPVDAFYRSGVRVAVGTDSLASGEDLNLFGELKALHALAPEVPPSRLLRTATLDGADALGFGAEIGSLEVGKRALAVVVDVGKVQDPEASLVGGIEPWQVRWL
jgi:cytosine/adenosine deaminase-related metal-dependent hydrolase